MIYVFPEGGGITLLLLSDAVRSYSRRTPPQQPPRVGVGAAAAAIILGYVPHDIEVLVQGWNSRRGSAGGTLSTFVGKLETIFYFGIPFIYDDNDESYSIRHRVDVPPGAGKCAAAIIAGSTTVRAIIT